MTGAEHCFVPRLLAVIVDRDNTKRLEDILSEKHVVFHFMVHGMGTASSEILKAFGLSGTEKTICLCLQPHVKIKPVMTSVAERLDLVHPGNGIAFVMPISGISATISNTFNLELEDFKERLGEIVEKEVEKQIDEARFELVVSVINQGFSDDVMDSAKKAGAKGGTIVHARRTGNEEMAKFFGISLQEEKEVVAILINREKKKELMQAISSTCGMKTEARGIIFSLPVEDCYGISEAMKDDLG